MSASIGLQPKNREIRILISTPIRIMDSGTLRRANLCAFQIRQKYLHKKNAHNTFVVRRLITNVKQFVYLSFILWFSWRCMRNAFSKRPMKCDFFKKKSHTYLHESISHSMFIEHTVQCLFLTKWNKALFRSQVNAILSKMLFGNKKKSRENPQLNLHRKTGVKAQTKSVQLNVISIFDRRR